MNLGNKNENVIYENWNSIAFHVCGRLQRLHWTLYRG